MTLILASSSLGRKKLLKLLKIPFQVVPPRLNEEKIWRKSPLETLRQRAKVKGEKTAEKILQKEKNPFSLPLFLLAADSGVVFEGKLFGKPQNFLEAKKMLSLFSGKEHRFITALYLLVLKKEERAIEKKVLLNSWEETLVKFRPLKEEEINFYLAHTPQFRQYAGAYALLASPCILTENIRGSLTNVIGLPLEKILPFLQKIFPEKINLEKIFIPKCHICSTPGGKNHSG